MNIQGPYQTGAMVGGQPMMAGGQSTLTQVVVVQNNSKTFEAGPWQSYFCGCFNDPASCILTCLFPCITYGNNYEAINKTGCCVQGFTYCCLSACGLCCLVHSGLRGNIRSKFNIPGNNCFDCLLTCFCSPCALCQESREIIYRRKEATENGFQF